MAITRSQFIDILYERLPQLRYIDVQEMSMHLLEQLSQALVHGRRIEVRGFGSFYLRYRKPRRSRNPKTGTAIFVDGKHRPAFRAAKELRTRVSCPIQPADDGDVIAAANRCSGD